MCKKLMFLISLVALLGLVNVAVATEYQWTGAGVTDSWCDAANWDPCGVPGGADQAEAEPPPERGPVIDCVVSCQFLEGNPDSNQAIDIVSGGVLSVNNWERRWGREGDGVATYNFSGGVLNIADDGDSAIRVSDEGPVEFNISGDFVMNNNGGMRMGDEGANDDVVFNMSGGTLNLGNHVAFGDDSGGTVDISGGEWNINGSFILAGRDGDWLCTISGGEINCSESFRMGKNIEDGSVTVIMSDGAINCETFIMNWDEDESDGPSTLTMYGGLVSVSGEFQCPDREGSGPTNVKLTGTASTSGTVDCGSLSIKDGGLVNILHPMGAMSGTLIIDGDVVADVWAYAAAGKIIAHNTRGELLVDYDISNAGKTTVTCAAVNFYQAYAPNPLNGAVYVSIFDTCCTWKPGLHAFLQILWFDESFDAVNDADPAVDNPMVPPGRGLYSVGDENYCPASPKAGIVPVTLELFKTYYWRVDSQRPFAPTEIGKVWSFSTGCILLEEDFNQDCIINLKDLAEMGAEWQDKVFWPPE